MPANFIILRNSQKSKCWFDEWFKWKKNTKQDCVEVWKCYHFHSSEIIFYVNANKYYKSSESFRWHLCYCEKWRIRLAEHRKIPLSRTGKAIASMRSIEASDNSNYNIYRQLNIMKSIRCYSSCRSIPAKINRQNHTLAKRNGTRIMLGYHALHRIRLTLTEKWVLQWNIIIPFQIVLVFILFDIFSGEAPLGCHWDSFTPTDQVNRRAGKCDIDV